MITLFGQVVYSEKGQIVKEIKNFAEQPRKVGDKINIMLDGKELSFTVEYINNAGGVLSWISSRNNQGGYTTPNVIRDASHAITKAKDYLVQFLIAEGGIR